MRKKFIKKATAWTLTLCLMLGSAPVSALSEESLAVTPAPSTQATAQVSAAPADETAKPTEEAKPTEVSSAQGAEAAVQATQQTSAVPTQEASPVSTQEITAVPTQEVTAAPTQEVSAVPTQEATAEPTQEVTAAPTQEVTAAPTQEATAAPTAEVSAVPTQEASAVPTAEVSPVPTMPVAVDAPAVSENARAVQALLDVLPSADTLAAMDEAGLVDAYKQTEVAYEAYLNLTSEEQSQIRGAEKFAALFGVFNGEAETLATEYSISIDSDRYGYGRAEIVGHLTSAAKGDTVTVKFIPNEGYEVDFTKVKIRTKLYDDVAFTQNADGTISFEMPDQGVSIEPAFKPEGSFALELMFALLDKDGQALNNSGSGAGSEDTSYGTVKGGNNVSFRLYNDVDTSVYLQPGSYSFELDRQYIGGYADADDITFTFNLNESGEISVSQKGSGVADVSVNRSGNLVNFKVKVNQIHTVELVQPENGSLTVNKSEAMQGEIIEITLKSNDKTVNYAPVITAKSTGNKIDYTDKESGKYSFTMPDDDVQLATVAAFSVYIRLTVKDDIEDDIGQDKWIAYLKETNFKIVYSYILSNLTAGDYTIGDFEITTGTHVAPGDISFTVTEDGRVTISERDDLELIFYESSNYYNLKITVPRAEGVYAAFVEKTAKGNATLSIDGTNKTASIVGAGTTVKVVTFPHDGFECILPTVTRKDGEKVEVARTEKDNVYTFVMPASDVYVTNAFQGTFPLNITLRGKIDGSIYYNLENIIYLVDRKEDIGQAQIESGKVNSIGLLDGDHTLYYLSGSDTVLSNYCQSLPWTINFHVDANAKVTSSDVEITQNGNNVIMSIPLALEAGYYGLNVVTSGGDENCSASFDNFCARKDETVKLNVSAASEEYRAGTVRVTDANGNALALTQVEGGYTFTMPESRVTAEVKFVPKYNVTTAPLTGGSVTLVGEETRFFPGDEVRFAVASKDDNAYYLQSDSVAVKCGETPVAFTANEGDYSFIMPEGDVTITAAFGRYKFTLQWDRTTKEYEVPEASDDPASNANTFMSWLKAKNMFSNATTGWRLCRDEKWEIVDETTVIRKGDVFKLAWMVEANDSVLVIYDSCTVEELSGVASDNYRLEEGGSVKVSHKVDGESKEFVIQKDHDKVLACFEAVGIDVDQQWYWYYDLNSINAVTKSTYMPIRQANFSRAFAVTLEQTGGDASCTASLVTDSNLINTYLVGETVTVQLNRSEDSAYGVYSVSVTDADGGNVALTEQNGNYCFTMPAKAVKVKVEWRKRFARNFIFDFQAVNGKALENIAATITLNGRAINGAMDVCVGENELKFTQLPEGYKLPEAIRFTMKEDGTLECTAANVQMSSENSDIHVQLTLFKEDEYRVSTTVYGAGSAFAALSEDTQTRIQGAEKGATVYVNTIPDEGYAVYSVKVLDAQGKELECGKNIQGFYCFTMPECDVSVVVEYKQYYDGIKTLLRVKNHRGVLLPQDDANKVTASIFQNNGVYAYSYLNTSQSAAEVQAYGYFADEYKLDWFNFEGYLLYNYKKPGGLCFSVNEDGSFTSKNPQLEISWDQNKKELTLTVILQKKDELYDVYLQSSGHGTLTADPELTQAGRTVNLRLSPESSDYIALVPTVTTESGEAVSLTRMSDMQYYFTMPAENVYVSATFSKLFSLKMQLAPTLQGAQYTRTDPVVGYLDGDVNKELVHEGSLLRTLHEGEHTLTITHLPSDCAAPENLTFKVDEQGNLTSESMEISKNGDCWLLGVPLELAQGRYALKLNVIGGDAESCTVCFNEEYSGKAGESMYLFVNSTTDSPYMVESVVLTDANGTVLEVMKNSVYYYFTMPESEVTGTVTFAKKPGYYDVLISSMENGTVTADKLIAKAGEQVKLTVEPAEDYKLNMLTVLDASEEELQVLDYAFTMPESNVTISALFTEAQWEAFSVYFQIQGLSEIQSATYMTNFSNWLESYNNSHPEAAYPFGSNCYWRVKRSTGVYEKVTESTAIQGNDIYTLVWKFGPIPTVYAPCAVGELSNEMLDAYAAIQFKNDGSVSGTHIVNKSTVRFVVSRDSYRIFDFLFDHGFDPYLTWLVDLKVVENALSMSMPLRETQFDSIAGTGRYPIACYTAITNGGAVLANGKSSGEYAKDTSISLTIQPDAGYRLKSLTVRAITTNGAVPIQLAADYSFLMPAYAVEVWAEFELGDPEFVITIPASVDLDQASSMSVSASGLKYMEGKKLVVDVDSENDYRLVQGENSIDYSVSANTVYFTQEGSVDLTFTLGDTSAGLPMGEYEDTLNFTVSVKNYSVGDGTNADSAT